jgi:hypothetical protein
MNTTQREIAGAAAESGAAAALGGADWLCLAAAPSFAIMALLTGVLGGGPSGMVCSAAKDASALSGMVPMYVLMSACHMAPWLRLFSGRRSCARDGSGSALDRRSGAAHMYAIDVHASRRETHSMRPE